MSLTLETGNTGYDVTAESDGALYASLLGLGSYVTKRGNQFEAEIQSNNAIKIDDGDAVLNGRHFIIHADDTEIVTINSGTTGYNRIDLIVIEYSKRPDGVESGCLKVIQGTETSGTPTVPSYTDGNILTGATLKQYPLYKVTIEGINITDVSPMFNTIDTIQDIFDTLDWIRDRAGIYHAGAGAHNAIYRGKYLGDSVTEDQWTAISSGNFTDLYIGDYWTIGNVNWRIAAFDYYLHSGDTECTAHHAVIVPDTCLYSAQMNTSNTTANGYPSSKMRTANLANAKTTINSAFGSAHVLSKRLYFGNAGSNGYMTAGAWYDSTVELMTEQNVYGGALFDQGVNGTNFAYKHEVDKSQYPLFAFRPDLIIANRTSYWLRNVCSAALFALVVNGGDASAANASYSTGVRPAFCIS